MCYYIEKEVIFKGDFVMFENDDFFKETIIDSNEENSSKNHMENSSKSEDISEKREYQGIPNDSSLIFSRDIDYKNPYMSETHIKKKKKS